MERPFSEYKWTDKYGKAHEIQCDGICFGLQYNCGLATECAKTNHDDVPHDCWVKSLARAEMFFWITVYIAFIVLFLVRAGVIA